MCERRQSHGRAPIEKHLSILVRNLLQRVAWNLRVGRRDATEPLGGLWVAMVEGRLGEGSVRGCVHRTFQSTHLTFFLPNPTARILPPAA